LTERGILSPSHKRIASDIKESPLKTFRPTPIKIDKDLINKLPSLSKTPRNNEALISPTIVEKINKANWKKIAKMI
jgi:hypothetical protein